MRVILDREDFSNFYFEAHKCEDDQVLRPFPKALRFFVGIILSFPDNSELEKQPQANFPVQEDACCKTVV